ncbi:hypothetical protein JOC34_000567 [Virgibacillus halotolerans]|uniref:hypothetical protein n=1 Tax=Virgibacillus halotolerans TaxID=1071053 RepID=UPI0019622501|nr:hypothetical protein [Virgibacillus halotolerans]MBM7598210.1 hypothetical protein [Virgibacillus halotolerans]
MSKIITVTANQNYDFDGDEIYKMVKGQEFKLERLSDREWEFRLTDKNGITTYVGDDFLGQFMDFKMDEMPESVAVYLYNEEHKEDHLRDGTLRVLKSPFKETLELHKVLQELEQGEGISADSIDLILNNHSDLLPYLDDEVRLQKKLETLVFKS